MSGKKSTSVSLDKEHIEWMDEQNINRSQLINDLLEKYRHGQSVAENAVAEYQLQQLEAQEQAKKAELEAIQEQKERFRERHETRQAEKEAELQQAVDDLAMIRDEDLDVTHHLVERWANKLDMPKMELLAEVEEQKDTDDDTGLESA